MKVRREILYSFIISSLPGEQTNDFLKKSNCPKYTAYNPAFQLVFMQKSDAIFCKSLPRLLFTLQKQSKKTAVFLKPSGIFPPFIFQPKSPRPSGEGRRGLWGV